MNYHITFTDVNGITDRYPGIYITLCAQGYSMQEIGDIFCITRSAISAASMRHAARCRKESSNE